VREGATREVKDGGPVFVMLIVSLYIDGGVGGGVGGEDGGKVGAGDGEGEGDGVGDEGGVGAALTFMFIVYIVAAPNGSVRMTSMGYVSAGVVIRGLIVIELCELSVKSTKVG